MAKFKRALLSARALWFAPLLIMSFACTENREETKWQYFPDMADAPTVKPQLSFVEPPPHSIATNAFFYPATVEEAEKTLVNPYLGKADEAKRRANGKELFTTFCEECHGPQADGAGRIQDKFPRAPSLLQDLYKNRKDGFYFYRITFGSAIMPSYGHATSIHERWEIVLYLRSLQDGVKL